MNALPHIISHMKKLLLLVLIAIVALLISGISDTKAAIADTSIPDNEVTSSQTEANNSSASAIIKITWRTAPSLGG